MDTPATGGQRIVVVDDEEPVRRLLEKVLTAERYLVVMAADGEQALEKVAAVQPDLVVLDLSLPGISGLEVCRQLRAWTSTPILILSATGDHAQKIAALDLGADDYVTKPFSAGELLARLRALFRRASGAVARTPVLKVRDLEIDTARGVVLRGPDPIPLTKTEFSMLAYLARHADCVVTFRMLARDVLGLSFGEHAQTIRVHVGNLRKKLEPDPANPTYVLTDHGLGYRLVGGQAAAKAAGSS